MGLFMLSAVCALCKFTRKTLVDTICAYSYIVPPHDNIITNDQHFSIVEQAYVLLYRRYKPFFLVLVFDKFYITTCSL